MKQIKVLVVDDSPFIRKTVSTILGSEKDIDVVGNAKNGLEAIDKVKELSPDVVTMDVVMPQMDGLKALKEIMKEVPTPVVMLSSVTREAAKDTFEALSLGAVDFIAKPLEFSPLVVQGLKRELIEKVKGAAFSKLEAASLAKEGAKPPLVLKKKAGLLRKKGVVAITSSTGGLPVLEAIFSSLPASFPLAIIVVQHIVSGFEKALAEHLNNFTSLQVKVAEDKEKVKEGVIFLAPPNIHLTLRQGEGEVFIHLSHEPPLPFQSSADLLFSKVAEIYKEKAIAVLLSGMGSDGVSGMKDLKENKGRTVVQDEATSVVFGMAKRAIDLGIVDKVLPVNLIANELVDFASRLAKEEK